MRKFLTASIAAASLTLSGAAAAMDTPAPQQGQQIQYDAQGRYVEPQALGESDQVWKGEDGQYHCKRKNGTTGLVVGAVVGGILGNVISSQGNGTALTILGAIGGGLLGRSIDKNSAKCQ